MRRLVILALIAAAAGAAGWVALTRPAPVETVAVARGEAAEIVYANGSVEPRVWARVAPMVRARIVEVCACEGDAVEAGAPLGRLDDREAQAVLAELEAREAQTARELERLRDLIARNVAARADVERAESEEARLQALIAAQRIRIDDHVLRAPVAGVVLRQDGEVGEIADPGEALFWVGQPKPLVVTAEINEEDIPRIRPGQRALLRSDAFPGAALEATVARITPMGDPVARTFRVRFDLPEDTPLLIGMSVEVNVVVRVVEDALLAPTAALAPDGTVTVVADGVARRVPVEVGLRGAVMSEIRAGLAEGDRVATPAVDLPDGARVTERPRPPAAP